MPICVYSFTEHALWTFYLGSTVGCGAAIWRWLLFVCWRRAKKEPCNHTITIHNTVTWYIYKHSDKSCKKPRRWSNLAWRDSQRMWHLKLALKNEQKFTRWRRKKEQPRQREAVEAWSPNLWIVWIKMTTFLLREVWAKGKKIT